MANRFLRRTLPRPLASLGVLAALSVGLLSGACQEQVAIVPCNQIPEGGCPRRGQACRDVSCVALYVCQQDGTWALAETCGPRDAGEDDMDAAAADAPPPDASYLDVEGAAGGPGCVDLEFPDCSLAVASACASACCGCEDVFVCRNGGWELWNHCGP